MGNGTYKEEIAAVNSDLHATFGGQVHSQEKIS
jgi:hypothetical protein